MPAAKTRDTIARHWELLDALPFRGAGKTVAELVVDLADRGFKVSKRQVERDLVVLDPIFNLVCDDSNKTAGWRWSKDAPVGLSGLTVEEAVGLHLVENTVKPLLPASMLKKLESRFIQAAKKIKDFERRNPAARLAHKVRAVSPTLQRSPSVIDDTVRDVIIRALLNDEQIDASYWSMGKPGPAKKLLHPLGLVQRGPVTYLIAMEGDDSRRKSYALHRFASVAVTHKAARVSRNFSLDEYISDEAVLFGGGEVIAFRAFVNEPLRRALEETPLTRDQKLSKQNPADVRWLFEAEVRGSWQLRWWVLSQGESIEVIGPASFRDLIRKTLTEALGNYQKTDRPPPAQPTLTRRPGAA